MGDAGLAVGGDSMMSLNSPFAVWGLVAAALVALCVELYMRRRRRVARAIGDPRLIEQLGVEDLCRTPWVRVALVVLAAAALAAALTDPRWGEPETAEARGGPVVVVFDVSNSMLAEDLAPDRLQRSRRAARAVAHAAAGAPVGIVAFAGRAYALAPPTSDPGAVELYLDALHPDMVTQTGSSLAAAVRQGLALLLATDAPGGGTLVVITDADTEESPDSLQAVVDLAARVRVPIYALGAGTVRGATVPAIDPETGARNVMRDTRGEPVVTRLGEAFLRDLGESTGGAYISLAEPGADERVATVVASRPAPAGAALDAGATTPARYSWFAGLALALLGMEAAWPRRRRR